MGNEVSGAVAGASIKNQFNTSMKQINEQLGGGDNNEGINGPTNRKEMEARRKEREEEYARKKEERAQRKSKLSQQWASHRQQNSDNPKKSWLPSPGGLGNDNSDH